MTIHAYAETYLEDAMNNLGGMFDYAVNDCGYGAEQFYSQFIVSGVADAFGRGNPKYVAGLSGAELASEVSYRTEGRRLDLAASENMAKSREYWAGWILAYYQWYCAMRFSGLQRYGVTMEWLLSAYPALHEADVSRFAATADSMIEKAKLAENTSLKRVRKASGMTQRELAEASGTSLRMIQLYEQRRQDIRRAEAGTVVNLSRALGCEVEDLLE